MSPKRPAFPILGTYRKKKSNTHALSFYATLRCIRLPNQSCSYLFMFRIPIINIPDADHTLRAEN